MREFIHYLKEKFKINWLDIDKTKIIELEKNHGIRIINDDQNLLLLKILADENKAILFENDDKVIYELQIDKLDETSFLLCEFRPEKVEDEIKVMLYNDYKWFKRELSSNVSQLVNRILTYSFSMDDKIHFKRIIEVESSIKIPAADKNFLSGLNKIKQDFDYKYDYFMNMYNT